MKYLKFTTPRLDSANYFLLGDGNLIFSSYQITMLGGDLV